ncbi:MAG TPA: SDR family NAD(P)-dependent oxidoreductase [Bryobacteraceae bacterium]|nr:SDR family NAD(P)-dependent oxidoreductase [Bryobacteraceae bacterium]
MTNKVAIITGGSRGLDRNTPVNLVRRGGDRQPRQHPWLLTLQATEPSPIAPLRKFAYNASMAAGNVLTIDLAAEFIDTNIRVNSVHPGWVKTALGSDAAPMSLPDGAKTSVPVAMLGSGSPNGRFLR